MKKRIKILNVLLSMVFVLVVISGCRVLPTIMVGWVETSGLSNKNVDYISFNGTDKNTICIEPGQTTEFDYRIKIRKGNLTLSIFDPDSRLVWEESFDRDTSGVELLDTTSGGCYTLQIFGERTRGGFQISWNPGKES
jgi:hypothetical protein